MRWEGREASQNVEDRRGIGGAGLAVGGGAGIILALLAMFFGVNPQQFIGGGGEPRKPDAAEERQAQFTKVVFRDTEVVWEDLFRRMGRQYQKPTLVLFTDQVNSACGSASAAVGPFYCPGDSKVYIDLSFYKDMEQQLKAPGEFARAYVIAHEVGHHVQRLLGYSQRVDDARQTRSKVEYNRMSVRLELQADYLAGVWAHHAQKRFQFLEPGDLESAYNAAFQIGDDILQKRAKGRVVPDAFTHGTSAQRKRWFQAGFQTGDVNGAAQLFDLSYDRL